MVLSLKNIEKEWGRFLRNSDIFTITQRGVTTTTDSGTFAGASTHLINVPNIKNIRSITIDASPITYGTDYNYDLDFDDSGTIKTKITFVSAQTGDYIITYDYGTDKVYFGFPRTEITISSLPRIGCAFINVPAEPAGFGGVNVNKVGITTLVYDLKQSSIFGYIDAIRTAVFNAKADFIYVGKLVQIRSSGPVLKSERKNAKDKVMQQNIDVEGMFNYEQ